MTASSAPEYLTASSRAARAVANCRASHPSWSDPVREARREGIDAMEKLAMAAIAGWADLADQYYAEHAQAELDGHYFRAVAYAEKHKDAAADE